MNAMRRVPGLVALVLALALAACGGGGDVGLVEEITLAAYAGSDSALVHVAQEKGFFADNGLNVTFKEYEAGTLAADALIAGEADIATSADFVFVSNSLERDDLRILGTIAESEMIELVVRTDRGISTPSDLKGKKIGVTLNSAGQFYLGTFLTLNGLSIADVEIVDLNPPQIVDAISRGDIDAGMTWHPNVYNIKQALGDHALPWPGQSGQPYYFVLLANDQLVQERPEAIVRFLSALKRAEEFTSANNDEAKELVRRTFGYDAAYLDATWTNHVFAVSLPQTLLVILDDQARWRMASGLTEATRVPNFLDYLYLEGLDAVRPEAVTIVR